MEKPCDFILVTFFSDVITMTSLKCRKTNSFKIRFRHSQFENNQANLAKSINFISLKSMVKGRWGWKAPIAWRFL